MNRLIIFTALLLPSLCFGQTSTPADQPASLNKSPELEKVDLDKAEVERLKSKQDPLPAYMLEECLGVKWGMSMEAARVILTKRKGVLFHDKSAAPNSMYITGGTFAEQSVTGVIFEFFENRFYSCTITLKPNATLQASWETLVNGLKKKYGPPDLDRHSLRANWGFPDGEKATESVNCIGNFVQSEVILIYTNRLIEGESEAARKVGASTENLQPE